MMTKLPVLLSSALALTSAVEEQNIYSFTEQVEDLLDAESYPTYRPTISPPPTTTPPCEAEDDAIWQLPNLNNETMDEIEDALYIFYFQADYYDCTNSTELGWYCEDLASTKEKVSGLSDPVKSKVSAYVDCMTKFWSGESCTC